MLRFVVDDTQDPEAESGQRVVRMSGGGRLKVSNRKDDAY